MNLKIFIGLIIIIGAASFLIFSGVRDTFVYYTTISELKAKDMPDERGIRVSGTIDPSSIRWQPDSLELYFKLTENDDTLEVYYHGAIPDQLSTAQVVVAEGRLNGHNFKASKLLLKCPSKYEQKSSTEHFNAGTP
ncbi:MAG: cytochrome c maturation protein CcmE [candidate division KSB1 bacterium]|nr:cytochrome c maturation protein CcmE [candidate division KSB1 bacterium]